MCLSLYLCIYVYLCVYIYIYIYSILYLRPEDALDERACDDRSPLANVANGMCYYYSYYRY